MLSLILIFSTALIFFFYQTNVLLFLLKKLDVRYQEFYSTKTPKLLSFQSIIFLHNNNIASRCSYFPTHIKHYNACMIIIIFIFLMYNAIIIVVNKRENHNTKRTCPFCSFKHNIRLCYRECFCIMEKVEKCASRSRADVLAHLLCVTWLTIGAIMINNEDFSA